MVEAARAGSFLSALACAAMLAQFGAGCTDRAPPATAAASPATCLPGERGYLRLAVRGALADQLDWRGAALRCEGGSRPAGGGLRVSFAGPAIARGQPLRIVFGFAAQPGAALLRNLAANVTIIVEGQGRLWATQGDGKCQADTLVQQPIAAGAAPAGVSALARAYRIAARGYCIDPATSLDGSEQLYVDRFDFAGIAIFEDNELHVANPSTRAAR